MIERTTAVFTDAMQKVVSKRGSDYRYPSNETDLDGQWHNGNLAVYRTKDDKQGACIIGTALLRILGPDEAPDYYNSDGAAVVMEALGWDERTALAAACAQIHQDWGFTWGDCLIVYVEALQVDNTDLGGLYSDVIQRLVNKHGVQSRWIDRRMLRQ